MFAGDASLCEIDDGKNRNDDGSNNEKATEKFTISKSTRDGHFTIYSLLSRETGTDSCRLG
jgi:hypothetical protein